MKALLVEDKELCWRMAGPDVDSLMGELELR